MFHCEAGRESEADGNLLRIAVHGIYVAEIHDCGLVAKMLQRHISQIEVYAFKEKIGSDKHFLFSE